MEPYADILHRQRPEIPGYAPMSALDRAAQFSPFAALTGYEQVIAETARWTDSAVVPAGDRLEELDAALRQLARQDLPMAALTVFYPDPHKAGGTYRHLCARIRAVDGRRHCLVLCDGQIIPFTRILDIAEVP